MEEAYARQGDRKAPEPVPQNKHAKRTASKRRLDQAIEMRHLAEAERHLAEGEARRAKQLELFERVAAAGHDRTEAQRLLDNITDLLVTARAHRRLILRRLEEA